MVGKKESTTEIINQVVQFILAECSSGKPRRGIFSEAIEKFELSRKTVYRYWCSAKKQREEGKAVHAISGKKGFCRRTPSIPDLQLLSTIHYTKRGTIRRVAHGLGASKSRVGRWVKTGMIRSHTSAIRPVLTANNKLLRLRFALEALELDRSVNNIKFRNMQNTIHIDEKWIYMNRASHRMYLAPGEDEPQRACKSKKFIQKIMFMCVVTRPLFDDKGEALFDGKICIFPFTQKVAAKRRSKNRAVGTLETKAIQSITKEVIKDCLINKVPHLILLHSVHAMYVLSVHIYCCPCIPAIISKWPVGVTQEIFIQQDNAKPHLLDSDLEFRAAATQNGFNIKLKQQPPNSPDMNVNDLGWFRSIQSLQVQIECRTVDELVTAVEKSFNELSPITLDSVFLSLQGCMLKMMKVQGHNTYKLPHLGKAALRRTDIHNLTVPRELAMESISYLKEMGITEGLDRIEHDTGLEEP